MPSLPREQSLIFIVHKVQVTELTLLESMKGPEAKVLYAHVLDELGKGLPGGKDKVKGLAFRYRLLRHYRWNIW